MGTRHRAALGIAEESDAIALVVSEETGRLSIAVDSNLHYNLAPDEFRMMLKEFNYEFEKLDARIDSIPVEKILDTMGIPKNYMDILDM